MEFTNNAINDFDESTADIAEDYGGEVFPDWVLASLGEPDEEVAYEDVIGCVA